MAAGAVAAAIAAGAAGSRPASLAAWAIGSATVSAASSALARRDVVLVVGWDAPVNAASAETGSAGVGTGFSGWGA